MSRKRDYSGNSKFCRGTPGPLPQRWTHCPRKASSIIEDKFLAFKTPLDRRYNNSLPEEFYFHPEMLISFRPANAPFWQKGAFLVYSL